MRFASVTPWLVTATSLLVACSESNPAEDDGPASNASSAPGTAQDDEPSWGSLDLPGELARLEGKWKVSPPMGEAETWEVRNGRVTVTEQDGTIYEAKLAMPAPGGIWLKKDDGSGIGYWYSRDGDDIYIGSGPSVVAIEGGYLINSTDLVLLKGETCQYFRADLLNRGEYEPPLDVKCALKDDGDNKLIDFQRPAFGKKDELEDSSVGFDPNTMISESLSGHKIEKIDG